MAYVVIAAAAVSLVSSGLSAYSQAKLANQSAEAQADQIRSQQLQLRLARNQQSLERTQKLRQTLATEEVSFGARGIAPGSGTILGIVSQNMHDYYSDENYAALNFDARKGALNTQRQMVEMQRKAAIFGAATGFLKEGAGTVLGAAKGSGMPTGARGSTAGAGTPTGIQSNGTSGSNAYFNHQFNLNG